MLHPLGPIQSVSVHIVYGFNYLVHSYIKNAAVTLYSK